MRGLLRKAYWRLPGGRPPRMAPPPPHRRSAPLIIEPVEPRLLLSANLTGAAALAVAESLHENLADFHAVLEAVEKFDDFGNSAPLVQIPGNDATSIGQAANIAQIFQTSVLAPIEQLIHDIENGPDPADTTEMATSLNALINRAVGNTDPGGYATFVTDNSTAGTFDFDFDIDAISTALFTPTLGEAGDNFGITFPSSLTGLIESGLRFEFDVRITDFSSDDDARDTFSLRDAVITANLDVQGNIPTGTVFNLGLLPLVVTLGDMFAYDGEATADFEAVMTHGELRTYAQSAAVGDRSFLDDAVDIASIEGAAPDFDLDVALTMANTITGLAPVTGHIDVTGSVFGGDWEADITGLDSLQPFGRLGTEDLSGMFFDLASFLGRLGSDASLDAAIPFADGVTIGTVLDLGDAFEADVAAKLGSVLDLLGPPDQSFIIAASGADTASLTFTPVLADPLDANAPEIADLPSIFHIAVNVVGGLTTDGTSFDLIVDNAAGVTTAAGLATIVNTAIIAAGAQASLSVAAVGNTLVFTAAATGDDARPANLSIDVPQTSFANIVEFRRNLADALGVAENALNLRYDGLNQAIAFDLNYNRQDIREDLTLTAGNNLAEIVSLTGTGDLTLETSVNLSAAVSVSLATLGLDVEVDGDPIGAATVITHLPIWPAEDAGPVTANQAHGDTDTVAVTGFADLIVILRDGSTGIVEFRTETNQHPSAFVVSVTDGNGVDHAITVNGDSIEDLLAAINFVGGATDGSGTVVATFNPDTLGIEIRDTSTPIGNSPTRIGFAAGTSATSTEVAPGDFVAALVADSVDETNYGLAQDFLLTLGTLDPIHIHLDADAARITAAQVATAINAALAAIDVDPLRLGLAEDEVVDFSMLVAADALGGDDDDQLQLRTTTSDLVNPNGNSLERAAARFGLSIGAVDFSIFAARDSQVGTLLGITGANLNEVTDAEGLIVGRALHGETTADRMAFEDLSLAASAELTLANLVLEGVFGLFDFTATGSGFVSLDADLTLTDASLQDLHDAAQEGTLDDAITLALSSGKPIWAQLDLDVGSLFVNGEEIVPNAATITVAFDADLSDLDAYLEAVATLTLTGLDEVSGLAGLTAEDLIEALDEIAENITFVDEVLDLEIWGLGFTFGDILDWSGPFRDSLELLLEGDTNASLEELSTVLSDAIGTDVIVAFDGDEGLLTITLSYVPVSTEQVMAFDLDIGSLADELGIAIPDSLKNLASASGVITVTAAATLAISLGVRLNDDAEGDRFFINVEDTGLILELTAEGSDLNFLTQLGPFTVGIEDGTLSIGAGTEDGGDLIAAGEDDFGIDGPARIQFGFIEGDTAGQLSFGEIAAAGSLFDLFEITHNVAADIALPVSFLGTTGLAEITVQIGNMLGGPDDWTTHVELPDFDDFNIVDFLNNPQAVINGLDTVFAVADSLFSDEVFGFRLPLIGDALEAVDDFISNLRGSVIGYLQGLLDDYIAAHPDEEPTTAGIIADGLDAILDIIGYDQHDVESEVSTDNGGQILFHMTARESLFEGAVNLSADFGIPGLGLNIGNGEISLEIFTALDLSFGYSMEEGFFFVASEDEPALILGFIAALADNFTAGIELGIISATATNMTERDFILASGLTTTGTTLSGSFYARLDSDDEHIGFSDVGDAFIIALGADATVDLMIRARIDNGIPIELPSVFSEMVFQYRYATILVGDDSNAPPDGTVIPLTFVDITLDVGEFLEEFLLPVLDNIAYVIEPLEPILDFLTMPLPGLSELIGSPTSLLTLAQIAGNFSPQIKVIATIVELLDQLSTIINTIEAQRAAGLDEEILISFGAYTFGETDPDFADQATDFIQGIVDDHGALISAASGFDPKNLGSLKNLELNENMLRALPAAVQGIANDAMNRLDGMKRTSSGGFSIPILENPLAAIKLLTGNFEEGVDLVIWDLPSVKIDDDLGLPFPVSIVPFGMKVGVDLDMNFDFQMRLGFDTTGLVQAIESGNPAFIFNGFYVDSSLGPQLEATIILSVEASFNTPLIKAGIRGAIIGEFDLALNDPNDDGKLRMFEFVSLLTEDPLNIFIFHVEVTARIDLWFWVGIDFFFGTITLFDVSINLVNETLISFTNDAPDDPILATQDEGNVTLNIGSLSEQRIGGGIEGSNEPETFTITGNGAGGITVEFDGATQSFNGVTQIIADLGDSNAQIVVIGKVNADIVLTGGDGSSRIDLSQAIDPTISLGDGDNIVLLAAGPNVVTAGNGNNTIIGNTGINAINIGQDTITLGNGNNYVDGGAEDDVIVVGNGHNTIIGGTGNDTITAGSGNNVIFGGVAGTFSTTTISAAGDAADGDNIIDVRSGKNVIIGGLGNDIIKATGGGNVILGDAGTVTLAPTGTVSVGGFTATVGGTLTVGDTVTLWFANPTFPTYQVNGAPAYTASVSYTVKATDTLANVTAGLAQQINSDADYQGLISAAVVGNGVVLTGVTALVAEAKTSAGSTVLVTGSGAAGGNDDIIAGVGNDIIIAGAGNDTVDGGHGFNIVLGDTGIVDGTSGGTGGQFSVTGNTQGTGNDILTTGSSADVVIGGQGADTINGSSGGDILSGDNATVVRTKVFGADAVLVSATAAPHAGTGVDPITGGTGNDIVFGGGQGDTIDGSSGDNVIFGDYGYVIAADGTTPDVVGTDTGDATVGADTITVSDGNNIIIGGGAGDLINITGTGATLAFGDTGEVTRAVNTLSRLIAETTEEAIGGDDVVNISGIDANTILGGAGKDTINLSGTGNNVMLGDMGIVTVAAATSVTPGTPHPITIPNGVIGDITTGVAINPNGVTADIVARNTEIGDNDLIAITAAASGNNISIGGAGDDVITSDGTGTNIFFGDTGEVTRLVDTAIPLLAITSEITLGGRDTISATAGTNYMLGGQGKDVLNGGSGDDHILGDIGYFTFYPSGVRQEMRSTNFNVGDDDVITTGNGGNYVFGGTGADTITGGNGRDTLLGDQGVFNWHSNGVRHYVSTIDDAPAGNVSDTILGGDGNDNLFGGKGGDVVNGEAGSDIVMGDDGHIHFRNDLEFIAESVSPFFAGPDIITGGPGRDFVFGGGPINNANQLNNSINANPFEDMIFTGDGSTEISASRIGKFELPPFLTNPIISAMGNWFRYLDTDSNNWLQLPAYTVRWSWVDIGSLTFTADFEATLTNGVSVFVTSHPLLSPNGEISNDLSFLFVQNGVAVILGLSGPNAGDILEALMSDSAAFLESLSEAYSLGAMSSAAGQPNPVDPSLPRLFGTDFGHPDGILLPSPVAGGLPSSAPDSDEQAATGMEAVFTFDVVNGLWAGLEPQREGPRLVNTSSIPRLYA